MATRFPTPFLPAVTLLKSRLTPSPPRSTYLDMSSPFPTTCKRTGAGKTQPRSHRLADPVKGRRSNHPDHVARDQSALEQRLHPLSCVHPHGDAGHRDVGVG